MKESTSLCRAPSPQGERRTREPWYELVPPRPLVCGLVLLIASSLGAPAEGLMVTAFYFAAVAS